MKLSDARPCDNCGRPWMTPRTTGYVVRISQAMISQTASTTLGLLQMFSGSLALAETLSPNAEEAILVFGEKEPALWTELFLCMGCYCDRGIAELAEQRNRAKEQVTAIE